MALSIRETRHPASLCRRLFSYRQPLFTYPVAVSFSTYPDAVPFPLILNLLKDEPAAIKRNPLSQPSVAAGLFPLILNLLKDEPAASKGNPLSQPSIAAGLFPLILNLLKDEAVAPPAASLCYNSP